MSRITDALKQARRSRPSDASSAAGPALLPIKKSSRPRTSVASSFAFRLTLVAALLGAGVLSWQWRHGTSQPLIIRAKSFAPEPVSPARAEIKPVPQNPVSAIVATPVAEPGPAQPDGSMTNDVGSERNSMPQPTVAPPESESAATNKEPAPEPPVVADSPPPPENFALQALLYRPRYPEAVINGITVHIGSFVDEARVVAIDSRSATLVTAAGKTNVLTLQEE